MAGLPLGSPMDVNLAYGITPMEHRERYREAFELVLKAWQAKEIFAWNGKYFQLGQVNLWPRPIQQPHPPVWVPGSGSISTFDFAVEHNVCYCFLSYAGARAATTMMDGYWDVVDKKGLERNPYRAGFLQLVAVSETDAQAEADYARHVEYFYHKCLHVPPQWFAPPGNQDYRSLLAANRNPVRRAGGSQDAPLQGLRGQGLRHRGQPGHGARALDGGGHQAPARGQPDAAGADRLDAARADAQEHRAVRPRGAARPARDLGRRGLGEPLVAREPARRAPAPRWPRRAR